jgi:peptidoglycan-associated lipoprotein
MKMKKSLLATVVLASLLAACSNNAVKNQPAAPVEDASKPVKSAPQQSSSANDNGASTASATQDSVGANPLKDPNNILSKRSVFFDFDKDEVKPEYRALVEAHGKYLVANPNAKLSIQGNADSRGSREYNLALGQRRSVAVKKAMNLAGAQDKQIETVSYGEEKATQTCKDDDCWSKDRRADIVYDGE